MCLKRKFRKFNAILKLKDYLRLCLHSNVLDTLVLEALISIKEKDLVTPTNSLKTH